MHQLRRTLFSLAGDRGSEDRSEAKGAGDVEDGLGLGGPTHLFDCLRQDIFNFQVGRGGGGPSTSADVSSVLSPALSSTALPPILCTLARSTDMSSLAAAAAWLEKEGARARDLDRVKEAVTLGSAEGEAATQRDDKEDEQAKDQANERGRKRGERE